jgi:hypothetical protein
MAPLLCASRRIGWLRAHPKSQGRPGVRARCYPRRDRPCSIQTQSRQTQFRQIARARDETHAIARAAPYIDSGFPPLSEHSLVLAAWMNPLPLQEF